MEKSKLNKANLLEIERPNEKQYRKSLRKVLIEKNYNNVYFARVGFNFNKLNSFFKNEKKTPQKIINIFLKINIFNEENIDAVIKNNLNEIIEYTQKLCNHFSIEILPTDNFPYPSILAIFNAEINNGDIKFTIKKNFYKIYSNNVEVTDEMKDLYKENYIKEVYNNNNGTMSRKRTS